MKPTIQTKQSFNHDEKRLVEEDFHKLSSSSDVQKDCTADTMSQAKPSVPQGLPSKLCHFIPVFLVQIQACIKFTSRSLHAHYRLQEEFHSNLAFSKYCFVNNLLTWQKVVLSVFQKQVLFMCVLLQCNVKKLFFVTALSRASTSNYLLMVHWQITMKLLVWTH